jgi:hypothetical protein
MVTKKYAENLLKQADETRKCIKAMIIDILVQLNARDEDSAVEFAAEDGQAPSFFSINCSPDADGTDVYIALLWVDENSLKANYYVPNAWHEGDKFEYNMSLENETCVDYEDILDWLKDKID